MTLLRFESADGGPVVVDSAAILAVTRVGVNAVIYTAGWRFAVDEDFDTVLEHWQAARLGRGPHGESIAEMRAAHPGVYPLVAHQYDQNGRPTQ